MFALILRGEGKLLRNEGMNNRKARADICAVDEILLKHRISLLQLSVVRVSVVFALLLLTALTAWAQRAGTKPIYPIKFKPGVKTTVVEGTVTPPHGEGDMHNSGFERYSLRVRAGQYLTMEISSDNHQAMFSLIKPSPDDEIVERAGGVKRWSGRLTESGDYLVTVFTREREVSHFKLRVTLR